jgi:hypothetical protein
MSWNYRIIAHDDYINTDDVCYTIHEVYYNKKGIPDGYTANAITISSEDLESLHWIIDEIKKCLSKPILSKKNFPEIYKNK